MRKEMRGQVEGMENIWKRREMGREVERKMMGRMELRKNKWKKREKWEEK